jgi:hypothetical protein
LPKITFGFALPAGLAKTATHVSDLAGAIVHPSQLQVFSFTFPFVEERASFRV